MGEAVSASTRKYMQEIGRKGGNATKRKYGSKHYSKAGKKGMASRWKNHTKA